MSDRQTFTWNVSALRQPIVDGQPAGDPEPVQLQLTSYWSPDKDFVDQDSIARSACAEAFVAAGGKAHFSPVSAALA